LICIKRFIFFQAEDGIRDFHVTGVQTCALPIYTIFSIKRFIGRRHDEVTNEEKIVPYEVTGGAGEMVKVRARGKEYTPQEISARSEERRVGKERKNGREAKREKENMKECRST